jgi:hypothetical protein
MTSPPDKPTIAYAVERAATLRRRRYQDDDRYQRYTEAALLEQVCGVEGEAIVIGDGWWMVGRVVDSIAHVELEVLCRPGQMIRLREIVEPVVEKAPPLPLLPERPKRRFSPVSEWNREYEQWREWQD